METDIYLGPTLRNNRKMRIQRTRRKVIPRNKSPVEVTMKQRKRKRRTKSQRT